MKGLLLTMWIGILQLILSIPIGRHGSNSYRVAIPKNSAIVGFFTIRRTIVFLILAIIRDLLRLGVLHKAIWDLRISLVVPIRAGEGCLIFSSASSFETNFGRSL